jgi:hypothetical protein
MNLHPTIQAIGTVSTSSVLPQAVRKAPGSVPHQFSNLRQEYACLQIAGGIHLPHRDKRYSFGKDQNEE